MCTCVCFVVWFLWTSWDPRQIPEEHYSDIVLYRITSYLSYSFLSYCVVLYHTVSYHTESPHVYFFVTFPQRSARQFWHLGTVCGFGQCVSVLYELTGTEQPVCVSLLRKHPQHTDCNTHFHIVTAANVICHRTSAENESRHARALLLSFSFSPPSIIRFHHGSPNSLLIMLTSLAPSPIARVTAFLCVLMSSTTWAFCSGVTRQQMTALHAHAVDTNSASMSASRAWAYQRAGRRESRVQGYREVSECQSLRRLTKYGLLMTTCCFLTVGCLILSGPVWCVCIKMRVQCFSYQTVTVDNEGKLSRDVFHEVGGRWRGRRGGGGGGRRGRRGRRGRALGRFPSSSSSFSSSCAISLLSFSESISTEVGLSPSLHPRLLPTLSGAWQLDHPFPRPPGERDKQTPCQRGMKQHQTHNSGKEWTEEMRRRTVENENKDTRTNISKVERKIGRYYSIF